MPYPSQIDPEQLIIRARTLLEADGLEQLSLAKLAAEFGVKAPSLYRYVASKNALLQAINTLTAGELVAALQTAADQQADQAEARAALLAMFYAYRAYAHANPAAYALLYNNPTDETQPDANLLESLALPLQARMAKLVGLADSLEALRGAWALLHGFVMLELNGQFRREGDLESAFEGAINAYLKGWQP